jgi:hypothetical protein
MMMEHGKLRILRLHKDYSATHIAIGIADWIIACSPKLMKVL